MYARVTVAARRPPYKVQYTRLVTRKGLSVIEPNEGEVVEAELVEAGDFPVAVAPQSAPRPAVDRHTILYPGQALPTEEDRPRYTERDLYVSERTAERLEEKSAPKNTTANYRSQRGKFAAWCKERDRVARPCTTATYVEYVAHLIELGYAPNSISTALSAIRTWMPEDQMPGTQRARKMLAEYRKERSRRIGIRKAPAITDEMLRAIVRTCDLRTMAGLRDRCILLLGRGALNRRCELADLLISDISVDDHFVTLCIRTSKTDQESLGEYTHIPADSDPLLDPISAVRDWLTALDALKVRQGPLFRALTSRGTLQNRATATERGDHVSGEAVNDWVRNRAYLAKIKNWQKVTSHGLRRGGAQAIAKAGGDPTKQGRWKPGSMVVKREYLDRVQSLDENPWLAVQAKRQQALKTQSSSTS